MSAALKQKPLTVTQRSTRAAEQASELLRLDDLKRVGAALAEAALEGVRRNPAFAAHVRALYDDMAPRPAAPKPRPTPRKKAAADIELIPVKSMEGYAFDPAAPPDPYFLLEFYGARQLPLALQRYKAPQLQEAVKQVRARNPGTRPKGTGVQSAIDYIVERLAGSAQA